MSKKKKTTEDIAPEQPEQTQELVVKEQTHPALLEAPQLIWKKIKINGDTLYAEYQRRLPGGIIKNGKEESNGLVHKDLRDAMQKLAKHVAIMADTSESVKIKDLLEMGVPFSEMEAGLEDIKVTGIVITGEDQPEGVVIIAQKKIGPKVLNLCTPNMKFEEEAFYRWMEDLMIDIHGIESEAHAYVFEDKYALAQLEMDFDDPEGNDEIMESEEA